MVFLLMRADITFVYCRKEFFVIIYSLLYYTIIEKIAQSSPNKSLTQMNFYEINLAETVIKTSSFIESELFVH
jgi:hypothetical protein